MGNLKTTRASCPLYRAYYAPDMGACAETCNEGYFPNDAASRCEACAEHCRRCMAWDGCEACELSAWRQLRFVRLTDGYCRIVQIPWRDILIGAVVTVVLLSI